MKFNFKKEDNDKNYKLKDYEPSEDDVNPKDDSKRDIIAFVVCVFISLVIWLAVSNADANNIKPRGEIFAENHTVISDIV